MEKNQKIYTTIFVDKVGYFVNEANYIENEVIRITDDKLTKRNTIARPLITLNDLKRTEEYNAVIKTVYTVSFNTGIIKNNHEYNLIEYDEPLVCKVSNGFETYAECQLYCDQINANYLPRLIEEFKDNNLEFNQVLHTSNFFNIKRLLKSHLKNKKQL